MTQVAVQPNAGATAKERNEWPRGHVIIPCHDLARYHHFSHDLTLLDVPDGTSISFNRSASIVQNLNLGIEQMLGDDGAEWAWIMGDDHVFMRDTLLRLLRRELPIVAPLCARRGPPFSLVVFDEIAGEDEFGRTMYHTQQFEALPAPSYDGGLLNVVAAGSAGMLVQREVFEAMEPPWFRNSDGITTNEDMEFCKAARAAGYEIFVDLECWIGHLGVVAAWPSHRDGKWGLTLDFQGQGQNQIFIPNGIQQDAEQQTDRKVGQLKW